MARRQKHRDAEMARRAGRPNVRYFDKEYNEIPTEQAEAQLRRRAAADPLEPSPYAEMILRGLQSKPVFQGPVDHATRGTRLSEEVIARRRRRARLAKRSRKINRRKRISSAVATACLVLVGVIGGGSVFLLSTPSIVAGPQGNGCDEKPSCGGGPGMIIHHWDPACTPGKMPFDRRHADWEKPTC